MLFRLVMTVELWRDTDHLHRTEIYTVMHKSTRFRSIVATLVKAVEAGKSASDCICCQTDVSLELEGRRMLVTVLEHKVALIALGT